MAARIRLNPSFKSINMVGKVRVYGGPFLQCWAGLPPAVLSPSVLNKGVETVPIVTQFSLTCAQTIPRLPGACLRQTELL